MGERPNHSNFWMVRILSYFCQNSAKFHIIFQEILKFEEFLILSRIFNILRNCEKIWLESVKNRWNLLKNSDFLQTIQQKSEKVWWQFVEIFSFEWCFPGAVRIFVICCIFSGIFRVAFPGFFPIGIPKVQRCDSKGAKVWQSCRSRKMLQNEYLVAKIGFDTAGVLIILCSDSPRDFPECLQRVSRTNTNNSEFAPPWFDGVYGDQGIVIVFLSVFNLPSLSAGTDPPVTSVFWR